MSNLRPIPAVVDLRDVAGPFSAGDLLLRGASDWEAVTPAELDFGVDDTGLVWSDGGALAGDAARWQIVDGDDCLVVHDDVHIRFGTDSPTFTDQHWSTSTDRLRWDFGQDNDSFTGGTQPVRIEFGYQSVLSGFQHYPIIHLANNGPTGSVGRGFLRHELYLFDPSGSGTPALNISKPGTNPFDASGITHISSRFTLTAGGVDLVLVYGGSSKAYIGVGGGTSQGTAFGLAAGTSFDGQMHAQMLGTASTGHGLTIKQPASPHADARCLRVMNSSNAELFAIKSGGDLFLPGGTDIELSTSTGTKIGTGDTQLLGFWGADPVDQPAFIAAPDTPTVDNDVEARSAINAIRSLLIQAGLMAPS